MDKTTAAQVYSSRPNSYVNVQYVQEAGHHVHADQPEEFNRIVNEVCSIVDSGQDLQPLPTRPDSMKQSGSGTKSVERTDS